MPRSLSNVSFACFALTLAFPLHSTAGVIYTGSHTWDGTETSMASRLMRNGVASTYPTLKAFPGTMVGASYYQTYSLVSSASATEWIITPLVEDSLSFLSIYSVTFDSSNVSTNYLGDQGSSALSSVFSVPVSPNTTYIIVANAIGTSAADGHALQFEVDEQDSSVPEPGASVMIAMGLLSLVALHRHR